MKINKPDYVGLDDIEAESMILKLYPNPADNQLNVSINEEISEVSIYNLLGSRVYTNSNVNSESTSIYISEFNAGYYFISVSSVSGNTATEKVIIK